MSIQDDIFDVEHALRRNPAMKKAFERIVTHLAAVERREEQARTHLLRLADGAKAFKELVDLGRG
ncbi:hypothetical protein KEU06_09265 [Pseudaminobacter sp. 19-2017]|uniref:Uncharacterized protein n=1 Tax=Pseudaminobacter soli (ex Zhang et al. 2022) TaxID=2831468 RepID=A0A942DX35_9HYPH|nr:hypothetical protein [Pseudaminobacter soli]MBS3648793.1 hypothetical protein [Pseudaminobacter soli]